MGKKAVLVGCNYPGKQNALQACANDVFKMKDCLITHLGFKKKDITILIDDDKGYTQPTKANILKKLSKLLKSASSGDLLFFQFSGHGELLRDNQSIVATDGESITSDDFGELVELIPAGATLTIVADCCHSGGLIEGAKEQNTLKKQQRSGSVSAIGDGFPYQDYDYVMDRMCPSDEDYYDEPERLINDGSSSTSDEDYYDESERPEQLINDESSSTSDIAEADEDYYDEPEPPERLINDGSSSTSDEDYYDEPERLINDGSSSTSDIAEADEDYYDEPERPERLINDGSLSTSDIAEADEDYFDEPERLINDGSLSTSDEDYYDEPERPERLINDGSSTSDIAEADEDYYDEPERLINDGSSSISDEDYYDEPERPERLINDGSSSTSDIAETDEDYYDEPERLINDGSSSTSDIVEADGVILLSACQSYEKAKEVGRPINLDRPKGPHNPVVCYGVFTNAITSIIEEKQGDVTNLQLAFKASEYIVDSTQNPGLYCSDRLADAPFLGVRWNVIRTGSRRWRPKELRSRKVWRR